MQEVYLGVTNQNAIVPYVVVRVILFLAYPYLAKPLNTTAACPKRPSQYHILQAK